MHVFSRLVDSVMRVNGVTRPRMAFVPGSPVDKSRSQLHGYIDGEDPISRRPFMRGVIEDLTRPLTGESRGEFDRSTPRVLDPDGEENLQRLFRANNWTDFLPIVLPTEARVEAMLAGTSRAPDEIVGQLRPTEYREWWQFTVEKVAVNAVMAGALPEYFPVILALAASGVTARHSTTFSMAPMVVVNGPVRNEIGMNCGIGALGPFNHANATIGRAYGLLSQNLQGGSVPGETYMGSLGNNFLYNNVTFAENEEASPWAPLPTRYGFDSGASTVSVFKWGGNLVIKRELRENWRERFLDIFESYDPTDGLVLVVDPSAARELVEREGFATREHLIAWIQKSATMRAEKWWDSLMVAMSIKPLAEQGIEPWARYASAAPDEALPIWETQDINVVVAGGETNHTTAVASGIHGSIVDVDEWR